MSDSSKDLICAANTILGTCADRVSDRFDCDVIALGFSASIGRLLPYTALSFYIFDNEQFSLCHLFTVHEGGRLELGIDSPLPSPQVLNWVIENMRGTSLPDEQSGVSKIFIPVIDKGLLAALVQIVVPGQPRVSKELMDTLMSFSEHVVAVRKIHAEYRAGMKHLFMLENLLSFTGVGIIGIDLMDKMLYCNRNAEALFDLNNSAVRGRHYSEVLPAALSRVFADNKDGIGKSDVAVNLEIEHTLHSDVTLPLGISINHMYDSSNMVVGYVVSCKERTLKKEFDETKVISGKLKKANQKLRELDKMKSRFIAVAGHELHTPLAIMRQYITLAREGMLGPLNDRLGYVLDKVQKNMDRLAAIVDEVLSISKMEKAQVRLVKESCKLDDYIYDIFQEMELLCGERDINLTYVPDPAITYAVMDREKIRQVLVNLIKNAIRYSGEGGEVSVRVQPDKKNKLLFSVTDQGPGIPKDEQEHIFKSFYQVQDVHRGKKGEGGFLAGSMGLGLNISQRIVKAHGGRIWVESEPGQGAVFKFTLPAF